MKKKSDINVCVSTGTWVVAMSVGGGRVALDRSRDTLVNANAFEEPGPTGVKIAKSATGTSIGCALLLLNDVAPPDTTTVAVDLPQPLLEYARKWRSQVN